MKKRFLAVVLTIAMVASALTGCGKKPASSEPSTSSQKPNQSTEEVKDTGSTESVEEVTLLLFSNLPDRKNGQGLVEQMIIDEYVSENPNVTIKVEALDEEAYKTKFKAYSMVEMPDVVSIWGQPSFLDEVLDAGVLAELNESDYADYGFITDSLNGFKKDGKLYGLPRNTDVAVFYYNQKMFEDNEWSIPTTYNELIELGKTINEADIIPVAMDGGDGWPMAIFLSDIMFKITGNYTDIVSNAIATADFSDPAFEEATQLLKDAADAGLFQTGYDSQDYGTANDIAAWNGGGYAVSAESAVKEEAIKFLNYMYQPDKLSKYGWENGVGMSAQDQSAYMTGDETELQKQIVDLVNNAASLSGTPINDSGASAFKSCIESMIQSVSNGTDTIEKFLSTIAMACK